METNPRDPIAVEEANAINRISPAAERAGQLARTRVRYFILALLFIGVVINYLDRANLALAIPSIGVDLHLNAVEKGLILSTFGWTYAFMQIPGGFVIDRLGPRLTYAFSLAIWSPLVIGFILATTNSFNASLVYMSVLALVGAFSYIFAIGKVYRIELKQRPAPGL